MPYATRPIQKSIKRIGIITTCRAQADACANGSFYIQEEACGKVGKSGRLPNESFYIQAEAYTKVGVIVV